FVHRRIAALVIENKRLRLDGDKSGASRPRRPTGPPWRIGWFGMLRCRRSLDILAVLAKRRPDLVRVEIFGRAAKPVARHIQRHLHANPALHFGGVYTRDELERLYASVHFTWAIDYFEENANSEWLLPNRIYEGGSCDIVPFALRRTETGRWLDQRSVGVLLDDPEAELEAFFDGLTPERYQLLKLAACAVPRSDVIAGRADCTHLAWILMTLVHRRQNAGSGEEAREAA
ncbi:MAG: glycosyl transferase family 1, partial [Rhizomicrobium sp.]